MKSDLVLIDTSSWIESLREKGDILTSKRVRHFLENGIAAWCDIISIELWNGAKGSKERKILAEMQQCLPLIEISSSTWVLARKLATQLQKAGYSVPAVDIVIAACAFENNIEIEHNDKHFNLIEKFR